MKLKDKIIKSGLSNYYIAQHSGINKSTVGRIRSGIIRYPRDETAEAIEKAIKNHSKQQK